MRWLLPFIFLSAIFVAACDDDLATGEDMQPTASVDTLRLGTILAGNPSPTYVLKLYNHNSKEIRLTSIALRNAATSGFRMNVDGMNGASFTQSELLRIASGDSLFMFVEATFPQKGEGSQTQTDYVDVICNGRTTTIVLSAISKDVRRLNAYLVAGDETWRGEEVQIYDSLVVASGATLTLSDSTVLYLHDKANIVVYGSLQAKGEAGKPVTIRGDRTDWMFEGRLPYDNLPSQWGNLFLKKESRGNVFDWTDIRGMSEGIFVDSDARFLYCHIKNSDGNLISCNEAEVEIINCELMNSRLSLFEAVGGRCEIVQSTLANYHFAGFSEHFALSLSDSLPLTCAVTNSIVKGQMTCPENIFDHCFTDDDPRFLDIDPKAYTFDLHLSADSPCKGAGTPDVLARAPRDLDGTLRPSPPSIGCYD